MSRAVSHNVHANQAGSQARPELVPTVKGNTLHVPTFAFSRCHQPSAQAGSGWIRIRGMRIHVCPTCKATAAHRAARLRAQLPEVA